jgi:hypothetical protein
MFFRKEARIYRPDASFRHVDKSENGAEDMGEKKLGHCGCAQLA